MPNVSVNGTCNENPVLNTLTHDVEFEDGDVREHVANSMCESVLTRTDDDGNVNMEFQSILNHRTDETVHKLKDKYYHVNNQKKIRKSVQGWDIEVIWKDGNTDWMPL